MVIAKNFIWTTLKEIFINIYIFLLPQIPDFHIVVYLGQILSYPNKHQWMHTSMESLFNQLPDDA